MIKGLDLNCCINPQNKYVGIMDKYFYNSAEGSGYAPSQSDISSSISLTKDLAEIFKNWQNKGGSTPVLNIPQPQSQPNKKEGLSTGAVIGISLGVLAIVGAGIYFATR